MNEYEVTFERIGRTNRGTVKTFHAASPADLVEPVYMFARAFLASKQFTVTTYDDGTGSIDGGRFGDFTWKELTPA